MKIIIPTDFSENAFSALTSAISLFNHQETHFLIVHIINEETDAGIEIIQDQLDLILERVEHLFNNKFHQFKTGVDQGSFITTLHKRVKKYDADLIVMGTKGRSNKDHISFGSNTLKAIQEIERPLLVVPQNVEFQPLKNVLFPTQNLSGIFGDKLDLINNLVYHNGATMHVLHFINETILTDKENFVDKLLGYRFRESEIVYKNLKPISIAFEVNKYVQKENIDLVAVVKTKHSFLKSFIHSSHVDTLELQIDKTFLIL